MLRYYRHTKPGLVALYDIRPGNGVGQFLQPRSLHGAIMAFDTVGLVAGGALSRCKEPIDCLCTCDGDLTRAKCK